MIFYFLVFFMLVFLGFLKKEYQLSNKLVLPFISVILIFFAAFRGPYVDKDYQNYLESFNLFVSPLDYFINTGDWFFYEPFYYLIPAIFKATGVPYYELFIFFTFAVIAVSITVIYINKISTFPILSIITWFSFYFLLHELTQIRAAVAAGLLIVCLYHHYHRNYTRFFVAFFFALMFHYTSLLILVILLLKPKKFNLKINLVFLFISLALGFLHSDLFIRPVFLIDAGFVKKLTITIQAINEDENYINFFNPVFLSRILITFWLFINHKKLIEHNQYAYVLLKLQLLSIFSLCAFSSIAVIAFRVSEFYGIVTILTLPLLVYTFRERLYGFLTVVTYSLAILVVFVVVQKLVGPYNLVFFDNSPLP